MFEPFFRKKVKAEKVGGGDTFFRNTCNKSVGANATGIISLSDCNCPFPTKYIIEDQIARFNIKQFLCADLDAIQCWFVEGAFPE